MARTRPRGIKQRHPLGSLPSRSGVSLLTAESGITTSGLPGVKISGLPAAGAASVADQLEVNQEGISRRLTLDQALSLVDIPAGDWDSITGKPATFPPTVPIAWADISGEPSTFPPSTHTHPSTEITDFAEATDDRVAAFLVAGSNVTLTHNDAANSLTIAATGGGGGLTAEDVDDRVAALLVAGPNVTLSYNDAANSLIIASTAAGGGGGTVTSTSVVTANGLGGTVATPTTTPAITLTSSVNGMVKGNGTALSAAVAGTDYMTPANVTASLDSYLPLAGGTVTGQLNSTTSLTGASEPALNIQQTWNNAATTFTGIYFNAVETAAGASSRLMTLQQSGVDRFYVTRAGALSVSGNTNVGASGLFYWSGRSIMSSPADGQIRLTNSTQSDFSRLQFGGTTNAFPAIKRNLTALNFRLADDSADAPITAAAATLTGALTGTSVTMSGNIVTDGGNMTVDRTGDAVAANMFQQSDAGQQAAVILRTATANRWVLQKNTTAEGGSDAGGDFNIAGYSDAAVGSNWFTIKRSTGYVGFGTAATSPTAEVHVKGAGQTTAALSTSTGLGNTVYLQSTTTAAGDGGMVMFGCNAGAYAAIKGLAVSGSNNTTGDVVVSTRRINTDATLTEAARFLVNGGTTLSGALTGTTATFSGTVTAPGAQIQLVSTQTGAVATGTTIMPYDNSVPQITEGNEYMTLAITPKSATSKLIITVTAQHSLSLVGEAVGALFRDAVANALAASSCFVALDHGDCMLSLVHTMTSGTTSTITFRYRAGPDTAMTMTFNGAVGAGKFGGTMASSIVISEVAV